MREHEMRMRVFRFLKVRMRNMIMPATVGLGIGLAVGGCKTEGLPNTQAPSDAGGVPIYSAVFNDAAPARSDGPAADSSAPAPDLAAVDTRDAIATNDVAADLERDVSTPADLPSTPDLTVSDTAQAEVAAVDTTKADVAPGIDGNDDLGTIVVKYIAPIPDAADDTGGIAPVYIAPVYSAITPDAAPASDGLVVRYMAQIPDAGADAVLATLYMAPVQS